MKNISVEKEAEKGKSGEASPAAGCADCNSDQMNLLRRLVIAFLLTLPLMVSPNPWFQMVLGGMLLAGPGNLFLKNAFQDARRKRAGMDLLIASSTSVIFLYSTWITITEKDEVKVYFLCEGILICLILFGRYLESAATAETASSVRSLMNLQPVKARVLRTDQDGHACSKEIAASDLKETDIICVGPGERIPADGVLIAGTLFVDESMVTGESVPRKCSAGDEVIGGTLNRSGSGRIRATRLGQETFLDQMIALVEKAQASGGKSQSLADRIAGRFIPCVFLISVLTFLIRYYFVSPGDADTAVLCACGVLVIACPCALGLAVPTSVMVGMGRGAELGILFRNADQLTGAADIRTMIFDKTGTLTDGRVIYAEAAGGESDFMDFAVSAETIRPDAKETIQKLEAQGIEVVMLSGDRKEESEKIAEELGIRKVISEVRPDGKAAEVEKLKALQKENHASSCAGMVGDGINDAPALAAADISFAIMEGTDIAKETAGILLPGSNLGKIGTAIELSKAVNRNIRGNLLWALGYNLLAIPLAACGIINPSIASAAMSFSSIAVLLHSLTLRKACKK